MTLISTRSRRLALAALLIGAAGCAAPARFAPAPASRAAALDTLYYPAEGDAWQRRSPAVLGLDSARLQEAVRFAEQHETPWPTDLRAALLSGLATGPHGDIVGPVGQRGEPAGLVLRRGYIAAEWGDTRRVEMTFSVTKSFVSTMAGLAVDRGLIRDVHDPVRGYVPGEHFASARNAPITWDMLLRQTSEWEGTLFGKPDLADRREGRDRQLRPAGSFWEYNDVRVNLASYALLHVLRRPLPEVLERQIMDPIGASDRWVWHGYETSYVDLDGRRVQSVSGGGHWGGGMWIDARDMARFGLLFARDGRWDGRQLLSEHWIRMATSPTPIRPVYGYMWWLNTDRKQFPSAPETSFFALGAGTNLVWVDPTLDLVAVVRWIDNRQVDGFIRRVMEAVQGSGALARDAA